MMTDFLWAGETLIGSSWTGERPVCVRVRKLYTYAGSQDDFNIWEFLCSPGAVLSRLKKRPLAKPAGFFVRLFPTKSSKFCSFAETCSLAEKKSL